VGTLILGVSSRFKMDDLPDIQGLSQQIATLHLSGDLILEQPVGKHIRRATIAQIMNAPPSKNSHLMLGGRECKYVGFESGLDHGTLIPDLGFLIGRVGGECRCGDEGRYSN
jgi:hypothetical protein